MFESEKVKTAEEVQGLCSIFHKFGIEKGSRVLDLSCGIGRHTIRLAKKGYQLIGYDPSSFFLSIARHSAAKEESNFMYDIRFYEGKPGEASQILSKHHEKNFDVIISMWQSFGYSDIENDIKMFKDVRKIASPDCLLIIDAQNRDWTIRNFHPFIIYDFKKLEVHETWKFNLERSLLENVSKFYEKDPNNGNLCLQLTLPTTMKLYSLEELKKLLSKAGWKYNTSYSNLKSLQPVSLESQRIITLSSLD